jgi:hypothetical protein
LLGLLALLGLARLSALELPLVLWAVSAGAWMLASVATERPAAPSRTGAAPPTTDTLEVIDAG